MSSSADDDAQVEALFGGWLARRSGSGEPEFEALCREEPGHAPRLHDMKRAYELLLECVPAALVDAASESFGARLERTYGADIDPAISLDPPSSTGSVGKLFGELSQRRPSGARYELEGELARGGMGAILRVFDRDLRRHLAMKRILEGRTSAGPGGTTASDATRLARFLEEAQVTGQLDHPGIVPVHELGLDEHGRVYFTMKLVQGRDLKRIFELAFEGLEDWNETRALGVILKACEAVAFAHKKGVIHRDLKPANVMVGNFGEVYVMDWGLARVVGRRDSHDLRLDPGIPRTGAPVGGEGIDGVRTAGAEARRVSPREPNAPQPLLTRDGDVIGTPAYMPPEQARGEVERLGPRSDVYSLGALLYHLLARRPPYALSDLRAGAENVLAQVLRGPPEPLLDVRADVPAELVSICEKAMAREPERRYADTLELANDLRAFLEHRVVDAYETGAWAEARKWVGRNKSLAAALAAALVLLVSGLTASLYYKALADGKAREAFGQARIAEANALRASEQERLATERANDVLSLSAIQQLAELVGRSDSLWPARAARIPEFEAWIAEARALVEGSDDGGGKRRPGLADHRKKLAELDARADAQEQDVRWWRSQLAKLVQDLEALVDPETGLDSFGVAPGPGWGMKRRLEVARTLEEQSLTSPVASALWARAVASIADPRECPAYGGLALPPQLGLVPIGRDPRSGLWEFADLETGAPAARAQDGTLSLVDETGIVFVLVPGGSFLMGAQKEDPSKPNFDPLAASHEAPVHEVTLAPFFLSKYEMTQGQVARFAGGNPSQYDLGADNGGKGVTLLHPVERVSPRGVDQMLACLDLVLPTEAQWECAARAGTSTPWWTGSEKESLAGAANLGDRYAKEHGGPPNRTYEEWLDDGYTLHAPVGSYRANPWGFHDVEGNVYEICRDGLAPYTSPVAADDGLRAGASTNSRVIRGSSYFSSAATARSARRADITPSYLDFNVGLRPARTVRR